jgi:dipeptidyl aminopeptidase/acylaminoacyl peptidase
MKLLKIAFILAASALLFAQADTALQKAIRKETVEGDLKGAIEQYKKLAQDKNRAVAAQALIHMGECYEKLGSKEADKQYELVISKFADQKDAVAMAKSRLGAIRTNETVNSLVWDKTASAVSPDGRYLSFSDRDSEGREDLMIHDLVTNSDRRLTQASKDESPDESAFSPDGTRIAFIWDTKQSSDLRVLSLAGNGMGTPRIFKNQDWEYDAVAWSPDGKWLATYAGPKGKPWKTILVSAQDGSQRELTEDYCLVFSPEGKYLACERRTSRSQQNIFIVDTSTGRETPAVVLPEDDLVWGWSKDGW